MLLRCQCHLPKTQFQNPKPSKEAQATAKYTLLELSHYNHSSYAHHLQSCSRERSPERGLQLHAHMIKTRYESDAFLRSALLNLYATCGCTDYARTLFDATGSLRANLISCNSIITMYRRFGLFEDALSVYFELRRSGLAPDQYTLSVLIGAAEECGQLYFGSQLHCVSVKFGYGKEEFVANSLMKMYAAFGRMDDSARVFEENVDSASVVAWNSMIARLVENELYADGLKLYEEMQVVGNAPTPATLSSVLKACAACGQIYEGRRVHAQAVVRGFVPNVILETGLVEFYSRCGELANGRRVFERMGDKNVLTWNSMIKGYVQAGCREEALKLFRAMRREGATSDKFTFPPLLSDATAKENLSIHTCIVKMGLEADTFVGTSLIAAYSRNHSLNEARLAFDDTNSKDVGVWASMISACVKNRESAQAIVLFNEMLQLHIKPSPFVFSSLFVACTDLSTLEVGKQIHGCGTKNENMLDLASQNAVITMYSHCGLLAEAWRVFNSISDPNVVSFNSMISALAQHGHANEASQLSKRMELDGVKHDGITLLNLLSAFNHSGLVNKGLELFNSMEETYGIQPTYQHYACIVDLLARAGEIEQAVGLIGATQFEPDTALWRIVLGACGKHQNVTIGEWVAGRLLELEPYEASNYVLMANVYARVGRWAEATKIRDLMEARGVRKEEGFSWIEIKRKVYKFGVKDRTNPRSEEIYDKLAELMGKIKVAGYEPDVSFTLHDMEEERREESLWYHGEKLAFAFGVISTGKEVTLQIMKNLRVCGDCHCAFKHFSTITGREIVLRDKYRFHHFTGGECSCGDSW